MKLRVISSLVICIGLLNGCIALPIPNDRQLSPEFFGAVTDAHTGTAIEGAEVAITIPLHHGMKESVATTKTRTSSDGSYRVRITEASTWYVLFLGPAEGACDGVITVTHQGYEDASSKASQFRSAAGNGVCSSYKVQRDFQLKRASEDHARLSNGL
jgi:hypothetical protein